MTLLNYTFTNPNSGTYTIPFDFNWTVEDTFWQRVEDFGQIAKFVQMQETSTVIALIVTSALVSAFGLIYFYIKARKEHRKVLFWHRRFLVWNKCQDMSNRTVNRLLTEKFDMNKRISALEGQLRATQSCLHDNIDREQLAEDLVRIISILPPKGSSDAIREIAHMANKFDIQITLEMKKERKRTREDSEPTRIQPKRAAAPKKFYFSDHESEDDKSKDPDYKRRK